MEGGDLVPGSRPPVMGVSRTLEVVSVSDVCTGPLRNVHVWASGEGLFSCAGCWCIPWVHAVLLPRTVAQGTAGLLVTVVSVNADFLETIGEFPTRATTTRARQATSDSRREGTQVHWKVNWVPSDLPPCVRAPRKRRPGPGLLGVQTRCEHHDTPKMGSRATVCLRRLLADTVTTSHFSFTEASVANIGLYYYDPLILPRVPTGRLIGPFAGAVRATVSAGLLLTLLCG